MKRLIIFSIFTCAFSVFVFAQTNVLGVRVNQKYKSAVEQMKSKATYVSSHHDEYATWTHFKAQYLGMDCDIEIARMKNFDDVNYICIELPATSSLNVFMDVYERLCRLYSADYDVMSTEDTGVYIATTFKSYDGLKIKISGARPMSSYKENLMIFYYSRYF